MQNGVRHDRSHRIGELGLFWTNQTISATFLSHFFKPILSRINELSGFGPTLRPLR